MPPTKRQHLRRAQNNFCQRKRIKGGGNGKGRNRFFFNINKFLENIRMIKPPYFLLLPVFVQLLNHHSVYIYSTFLLFNVSHRYLFLFYAPLLLCLFSLSFPLFDSLYCLVKKWTNKTKFSLFWLTFPYLNSARTTRWSIVVLLCLPFFVRTNPKPPNKPLRSVFLIFLRFNREFCNINARQNESVFERVDTVVLSVLCSTGLFCDCQRPERQ